MKDVKKKLVNPMKMMLLALALVVTAWPNQAQAQNQRNARSHPGYVNLERMGDLSDLFESDAVIEVNVEGALMKLVAEASRFEDPELADLLLKLRGVYVRAYTVDRGFRNAATQRASEIGEALMDEGWSSVVRVPNRDEHVQMFVNYDGDNVAGMVVMTIEEGSDEAVFVNIVGEIDPAQIGRIGRKFNIGNVSDW